ncbi:hypothetical protein HK405_011088 [Cladochytrium tenue]|nr:hypothetical protein HK405_011088 [Cladochytrium tenue]
MLPWSRALLHDCVGIRGIVWSFLCSYFFAWYTRVRVRERPFIGAAHRRKNRVEHAPGLAAAAPPGQTVGDNTQDRQISRKKDEHNSQSHQTAPPLPSSPPSISHKGVVEDGTSAKGDILICADGIHSAVRAVLFPGVVPVRSYFVGYVGLADFDEDAISKEGPGFIWSECERAIGLCEWLDYHSHSRGWTDAGVERDAGYSRCVFRYMRLLADGDAYLHLIPEERDLIDAVENIQAAICSTLVTVGLGVEALWVDYIAGPGAPFWSGGGGGPAAVQNAVGRMRGDVDRWRDGLAELSAWLGWEVVGCKDVCEWDERCYIPMWPFHFLTR